MGSLTKLQVYMLKTLINEPLKAFKLRKKYTRSFDYMFKYAFGKSFGVEIEINPSFYKNSRKGSTFFNIDPEYHGFTKQITLIEKTVKSEYRPRRYRDGNCHEYTFPVRAQNLHLVYKYLKQIRRLLIGELGVGDFDKSSSMHIHLIPSTINLDYMDMGIYHYFNSFESQLNRHSGPGRQTCIEANRMLVLKSANSLNCVKNCHMCHGCQFNILDYIDKPIDFKKYLIYKLRRRFRCNTFTMKSLIHPMYRLLYLMKDGPRKAEKVYLHALELMDLKYRNKLAFILGQYDETKLEIMLDHSIAYFIPYMSEIDTNSIKRYLPDLSDTITYHGQYNSIEVRLFAGSTDFSTIMKRTLMYNSLKTLIATSDPTLLNLFLTII